MTTPDTKTNETKTTDTTTRSAAQARIREDYAHIARTTRDAGCCAGACGVTESIDADELAARIGYTREELDALPKDANMGLSCGNPGAIAALAEGETVLDLGAGAGFDCFLAGPRVGAGGRVIGVDMTPEMVARARGNTAQYERATGLSNVEFRLGEIEHLPVADASVDVILSNCVVNLSFDKPRVWEEVARVLRPGGRVAISDIALFEPLPEEVRGIAESWAGCVAGASLIDDLRAHMTRAGLGRIVLTPKPGYVEALVEADDPLYARIGAMLPEGRAIGEYITSVEIRAVKPGGCGCAGGACG